MTDIVAPPSDEEVVAAVNAIWREYEAAQIVSDPDRWVALVDDLVGGGSHFVLLGAFLTPLPQGTHSVVVSGVLDGNALDNPTLAYAFSYTVIVK